MHIRPHSSFTPKRDGSGYLLMGRDQAATLREIAKFSRRDAEAFPKYEALLDSYVRLIEPLLDRAPIVPAAEGFSSLLRLATQYAVSSGRPSLLESLPGLYEIMTAPASQVETNGGQGRGGGGRGGARVGRGVGTHGRSAASVTVPPCGSPTDRFWIAGSSPRWERAARWTRFHAPRLTRAHMSRGRAPRMHACRIDSQDDAGHRRRDRGTDQPAQSWKRVRQSPGKCRARRTRLPCLAYASQRVKRRWTTRRTHNGSYVLLHHVMGEVDGNRGAWAYVEGGMGAVSGAIARSAIENGAHIVTDAVRRRHALRARRHAGFLALKDGACFFFVTGARSDRRGLRTGRLGQAVRRVTVDAKRKAVTGVELADGRVIKAPIVLSNATPKVTFLDLVDPVRVVWQGGRPTPPLGTAHISEPHRGRCDAGRACSAQAHLPSSFLNAVRNIDYSSGTFKINGAFFLFFFFLYSLKALRECSDSLFPLALIALAACAAVVTRSRHRCQSR